MAGEGMRVNPQELAVLITAAANALYESVPAQELAVVAAVLVQLGDTLGAMAAQAALLESREQGQHR